MQAENTDNYGNSYVTDATTADDVAHDEYTGHKSKTVLFPLLFVVGTIGNIVSIIIFANRKMRPLPVYGGFLALAVCDVIILWLFSGSDWLVATFNIDPYDSSQLSCQISTFFRQSIITFNDWWLIVLALVYVITTSSSSHVTRSPWKIAGLAVALVAIAVGIVVCTHSMYDNICIHIANSLSVQRAIDALFCLCGLCTVIMIVVFVFTLCLRGSSRKRQHSQQSNRTLPAVEASDFFDDDLAMSKAEMNDKNLPALQHKVAGADITIIILLSLLFASLIPLILAIVASETESLSFALMFTLNENFYDVFISLKIVVYVLTLPGYRRRLMSLLKCKCCQRRRRFNVSTVAANGEHQETAMMS